MSSERGPSGRQVRELLEELVQTSSPSGEEAAAAIVLVHHLDAWGLVPHVDGVGNVIASRGPDGPDVQHVVLLGHLDTYPGNPPVAWKGDTLWGRGAVDAKGPLVAHAAALARLDPEDVRVSLVAAPGEEAESPGARHLARFWKPNAVLIAEPTGLTQVGIGYKGCLKARLEVRSEPAHAGSAVPTATEILLRGIGRLTEWTNNPQRDPAFDKLTLRVLGLSSQRDGLEDVAEAWIDLRLPSGVPDTDAIERLLPEGTSLSVKEAVGAVKAEASGPVATAIRSALRARGHDAKAVRKTGTSDWNVVGPLWGCPGAAYGPGDAALDHTPQERIDLREVIEASHVITQALGQLPKLLRRAERAASSGAAR